MNRKEFSELLNQRVLFLDGAYGTEFFKMGIRGRMPIELLNITNPDAVYTLQKAYVNAGVDFLLTNTFSANRLKMQSLKVKENIKDINFHAVKIAKDAAKNSNVKILGDISSTGILLTPLGELSFDEAYEVFKEQGEILLNAGIDGFIIETMSDLKELKAAFLALRDLDNNIPIIAHLTFEENGRTVTGTSVEIFATLFNDLDVDVIGMNCTLTPEEMIKVFQTLSKYSKKPISVEPNAGKPKLQPDGSVIYNTTPEKFSVYMEDFVHLGANIIGGCCGTGPEHIKLMREFIGKTRVRKRETIKKQFLSSRTILRETEPFLIIGERINASGKKNFQNAIREYNFDRMVNLATAQEKEGSHVLDINLGIEKLLDKKHFEKSIIILDKIGSIPLSLDIQQPEFMEVALKEYVGRPLINSSTVEKEKLDTAIRWLKRYGGMLILLTMKNKIPETAQERFEIAMKGIKYLEENGISKDRIFVDPLVLPVGAKKDPFVTLETIKLLSEKGIKTSIGLSNLSFGLPSREGINASFLSLAIHNGLSGAILNSKESSTMNIVFGSLILHGMEVSRDTSTSTGDELADLILKKKSRELKEKINLLLKDYTPLQVSQNILAKTMEYIGELYSKGEIYLPQLILAAETVTPIFEYLNNMLKKEESSSKGTILVATVEGDVHDIGKKIVATVLKSSGYEVIDIGKDIPGKIILEKVKELKSDLLGLSAMMTTTVGKIKEVKDLLLENGVEIPIIAGGASMNKELASKFGVFYAKNANEALKYAKRFINNKKIREL
ncbi:Homocysteine S-methyltransferase/B12 binding domain/Pterin binding enzyme [Marinitoga piezophila KA3]|uniref:Methionine synthase n=1 Tax=Marinitoga piezophila (strain DSM 14283 / JCM 11233 / KA3) TaxID=443254 RepID=H2J4L7_MARPK|nr:MULTISPECIES: homocysteine S-methyltransferase family protein [Marinitoga]AEX85959.1 Homocysteine S-methyltransferase/B12 binding domain/Pterin binding enzyme [Marinitoga piezophila KA3]APT76385.1 homocysteine methyltransferase [Marinitoga sp. 1137]